MPAATFYMLPSRFWEFMIGALAVDIRVDLIGRRLIRELIAALGLIMASHRP